MYEISVIVPVYNVEKYIKKCIESILNQTFNNFELILVNDGSTDKSGEICDLYLKRDTRIKVIHKNNSGVSDTRNVGIKNSLGKYIQFIDPDDWIEKDLLMMVYKTIEKEKSDVVFCGIKRERFLNGDITENIASEELVRNINKNKSYDAIRLRNEDLFGFTWCKLFKSSIIKENNILFDKRLSLAEDEKFTCDYYRYVNKISIIRKAYYHYVIYGNERNTLCKSKINTIFDKDIIFDSWIKCISNDSKNIRINVFLANRAFSNLYEEIWNICYSNNNRKQKVKKIKYTILYKYLKKNKQNIDQLIFILLIKYELVNLFKIYNVIRYRINTKN